MTEAEVKALEAEKQSAMEKASTLEAQVADLNAKVQSLEAAVQDAAVKATDAAPLRAAVVAELARLAGLAKRDTELDAFKAAFGADLETMPSDKLLALQADWTKIVDETLPGGRKSTPSDHDNEGEPETFSANLDKWA